MLINEGANTALAARIQESPADSVSGKSYVKMSLLYYVLQYLEPSNWIVFLN